MPTPTVEDVFVSCLSSSVTQGIRAEHIMQATKAWLTQHEVLRSTTAEDFFAQPDTFGWSAAREFLLYWMDVVTGKFLKFAASEYAYFHLPAEADTMWLTVKTSQLIKLEHLKSTFQQQLQRLSATDASLPWRWGNDVDTVAILHALLFVLVYYERTATAARVLEPLFLAIVREQEEIFTVVPQLLSYFLPHMSFQNIAFPDRIALLSDQLAHRGFQFSAGFTFVNPSSAPQVVDVAPMKVDEVLRRVREVSDTTEVRLRSRIEHDNGDLTEEDGLSLNKYLSAIVRVCRQYYVRCKQASKKQRKNGEKLLKLMPSDVHQVMKELHSMLRFGPVYSARFQNLGLWKDILMSNGWVPLQVVDGQLSLLPNSVMKDLSSSERGEIVESLLRQHDNFQRYQVDFCAVRGSAFHGQRCARSVYGHALLNPPLYRHIICQPDCLLRPNDELAIASLPLYGWVALSAKPQKSLDEHMSILRLFDNIAFCVVMPAEAIGAFRDYDETTPQTKKYDEKLRKKVVYFAEVYLRALARDGEATVLDMDGSDLTLSSPSVTSRMSSAVSSLNSRTTLPPLPPASAAATPSTAPTAPGSTTEVYSSFLGEASSKTQRWYVFPQYYVKTQPKGASASSSPSRPPASTEKNSAAAPQDTVVDVQLDAVRRRAPQTSFHLGVPKLFFTGRLAELRELRPSERSRRNAVISHGAADEDHDGRMAHNGNKNSGTDGGTVTSEEGPTEDEDDNEVVAMGDAQHADDVREGGGAQLARYRGTPREFDVPTDDDGDSDNAVPPTLPLCEYTVVTSRAPPSLLPSVVVRARFTEEEEEVVAIGSQGAERGRAAIRLSAHEPASALYRSCFPPSRMQSIFRDYADDFLIKEEVVHAGDAALDTIADAAEWSRAANSQDNSNWGRRLGRWGVPTPFLPPSHTNATTHAAAVPPTDSSGAAASNVASLREALAKFIASDQLACVLEVRVTNEEGVPIDGSRKSIEELKLFAKERALTYAKVGKASSWDRRLQQQHQQQRGSVREKDSATSSPTESGADELGGVVSSCDSGLVALAQASSLTTYASPSPGPGGGPAKILDLELMEFRKRVSWSVRDLEHILNELQLSASDVPYATLTTALTRECEDRSANYELLEFIGDAVMDFLVVADACLLSHAAYQRRRAALSFAEAADGAAESSMPSFSLSKWAPEASCVPLPPNCWESSAQPLTAVMTDRVTSVLCRNRVIAELLPPTVARHFSEEHYPKLAMKVRADVFEAIIGAAYRSGTGLDRLRLLLRRLFSFLPAATRAAAATGAPCRAELLAALQMCPYLLEADALCVEKMLSYRTNELLELAPALREVDGAAAATMMAKEAEANTHLVSSRLPRIQAKEYATMFTTGSAYSYRRLFSFDTVRVHNRILHLFSEKSIGFLNEIFTNTIHLVLDIDKVALLSWGLLRIMWEWYTDRYRCPAGLFALDCSGRTMVNKELKWKDSCHIHFPQVTVSVETWDSLVTDIRDTVVAALAEKEARLQQTFTAHAHEYRLWLRRGDVLKAVEAVGGQPRPHLWSYCDADSLFHLSRTCRGVRQSVLEHVAYATHTLEGMAKFAELSSADDIFIGDGNAEELVVVEHRPTQHRLILPLHWIAQCSQRPPCAVYKPKETWNDVIDQGLTKSKKLRLYLNDKCDTIYGVERRPLVLDTLLLAPSFASPPASSTQDSRTKVYDKDRSNGARGQAAATQQQQQPQPPPPPEKNFVLYRPQRFDRPPVETTDLFLLHRTRQDTARQEGQHTIRREQSKRLPGAEGRCGAARHVEPTASTPTTEEPPIRPMERSADEFGDDFAEGWVVECAHRSTLTLSSLRTSEYRGTDARTYTSWVDCAPRSTDTTTLPPPLLLPPLDGHSDILPSFDDIYERRAVLPGQLEEFEWVAWFNFFKMRSREYVMRDDKASTIRVWSPSWWAFNPALQTATFCIATEPVLRLRGADSLAMALAPAAQLGGGGGLERVAQLFMPQISTRGKTPVKVKDNLVFLLFPDKTGSLGNLPVNAAPNASPAPPSARSPPTQGQQETKTTALTSLAALPGEPSRTALATTATTRVTFGALPSVVSLAAWIDTQASPLSPAAWLRRAVSFVFRATAARTEFGCVPLVLCATATVYAEMCLGVRQESAGELHDWLPFVLPLQDTSYVAQWMQEARSSHRGAPRHIFVVTPPTTEGKADGPVFTRAVFAKDVQTFYQILRTQVKESAAAQHFFYVRTDWVRRDVQAALSQSARAI
ncbi:dicer-like protein [Leptomonas pyrrhocoris]|uniref:Dicer-like protein n=1 Tax=Leptomonas pyrrhocoris TaxID=157538 RepID=A0A0N0DYH2_LEPPY|nr:dicer-like protein [Leptomonas pyrrhocoris]XP_015662530.1 dicer-like protein [Leptomonas pyrrhocoris]KPA84090.1 dicer-like protein [Leptomonas pyrrhocoris]KPA84091.1 dicer-like protein [Leptomonas pyrrhocoris]|eukprot:XP_015662529.1 dicer-like protein [Leptomonas pyrrhocoris]